MLFRSNPFALGGSDFDMEYAHLDPQVYFHEDRDPGRALLSGGELIGHWIGPNAESIYAAFTAPPFGPHGNLRLAFEQLRWGLVGGLRGIDLGFIGMTKREKRWITGDVQVERTLSLGWTVSDWKIPLPGRVDAALTLARVDRTGTWLGKGSRNGWQAEARFCWRIARVWAHAGSP